MARSNILVVLYRVMRKLAKSNKYQLLYAQYKETGVSIFKNKYDFTDCQISFLQYLSFYSNLYTDIYMDEVSDIVLEDSIYEDSYVYYKHKTGKKTRRERNSKLNSPRSGKPKPKKDVTSSTHIVFSRPKIKPRGK